jgi:hypothetical protein
MTSQLSFSNLILKVSQVLSVTRSDVNFVLLNDFKPNYISWRNYEKIVLVVNEIFKAFDIKCLKNKAKFNQGFKVKYRLIGQDLLKDFTFKKDHEMTHKVIDFFEDVFIDYVDEDLFEPELLNKEFSKVIKTPDRFFELKDKMKSIENWCKDYLAFIERGFPYAYTDEEKNLISDKQVFFALLEKIENAKNIIKKFLGFLKSYDKYEEIKDYYRRNATGNSKAWFINNVMKYKEFSDIEKYIYFRSENRRGISIPKMSNTLFDLAFEYFTLFEEIYQIQKNDIVIKPKNRDIDLTDNLTKVFKSVKSKRKPKKSDGNKLSKRVNYRDLTKNKKSKIDYYKMIEDCLDNIDKKKIRTKDIFKLSKSKIREKAHEIAHSPFDNVPVIYDLDIKNMKLKIKKIKSDWYSHVNVKSYHDPMSKNLQYQLPDIFRKTIDEYKMEEDLIAQRRAFIINKFNNNEINMNEIKNSIFSKIKNKRHKREFFLKISDISDARFIEMMITNILIGYIPKELLNVTSMKRKGISYCMKSSNLYAN